MFLCHISSSSSSASPSSSSNQAAHCVWTPPSPRHPRDCQSAARCAFWSVLDTSCFFSFLARPVDSTRIECRRGAAGRLFARPPELFSPSAVHLTEEGNGASRCAALYGDQKKKDEPDSNRCPVASHQAESGGGRGVKAEGTFPKTQRFGSFSVRAARAPPAPILTSETVKRDETATCPPRSVSGSGRR